ncbi:MAG: SRPBCC family protein [Candidatus Zixiibacteriota bacterium]|nr:MAG: SRPBCC family protein [candidate division Zixibacteria bacterium]
MLEKEYQFTVKADPEAVSRLLGDLSKAYYLFPMFASAEPAAEGYSWKLKHEFRAQTGIEAVTARVMHREVNRVEWEAAAPRMSWKAAFHWRPEEDGTRITGRLTVKFSGLRGKLYETLLLTQIPRMVGYFEARAREILEQVPWLDGVAE